MHKNTVFSTKNTKKISGEGAHPSPGPSVVERGTHTHPLSAYGASTTSMLKSWVRHWVRLFSLIIDNDRF